MTPNAPLPIPSKAAIRALRGLVLGTSCTLALITEDRRRRINAARSAIRNGDRIRSARRYHAGGSAFAVALEEESLAVEPGVIHWTEPDAAARGARGGKPAATGAAPKTPAAPPPGLLDWSDAVPSVTRRRSRSQGPDTHSTSWRTSRLLRDDESPVAVTAASLSLLTSSPASTPSRSTTATTTTAAAADAQPPAPDAPPSSAFPFPPPRTSLPRQVQGPGPSLAHQAQAYCDRTRPPALVRSSSNPDTPATPQTPIVAVDVAAAAARILELAATAHGLEAAVETLVATAPVASSQALWDASAVLCRACQAAGRMDLAQDALQLAVRCGQLDEATYFAHDPLPVVRSVAPLDDLPNQTASAKGAKDAAAPAPTPAEAAAHRRIFAKRLRDAVALFLPPSAVRPPPQRMEAQAAADLAATARALLECAFAVRAPLRRQLVRSVYSAVAAYPGDLSALAHWFAVQLRASRDYETLLWAFLARPPTDGAALADKAFFEMGDCVVEAVRLSPSPQAAAASIAEVLQRLLALCSTPSDGSTPPRRLKTAWVADLFYTQWQRTHDFAQTQRLFAMVAGDGCATSGVAARVYHANGAYRAMVQIALEAGRASDAQRYFDELVAQEPAAEGDIRLLGLFALAKAKQGDWAGVRADFATAAALAGSNAAASASTSAAGTGVPVLAGADRVFVPIVKEHLRTHPIGETEAFLRSYIDELGVPVGRELVTLLANAYGALGEVQSFVGWLTYCAGAGFAVDAAFSNAILQSCHRHWKFGFRALRTLHRELCALSPCFEDDVTQTILAHAALADASKHHRHHHVHRPRPLSSASASGPPVAGRPAARGEHDLYLAMKQAFAAGHPAKTVRVYKLAVRDGRLVPGGKCLKLAVAAALRCGGRHPHGTPPLPTAAHFDAAMDLLRDARAAGQDIDAATTYIALAYIDALCPRAAFSATAAAAASSSGRRGSAARAKAVTVAQTVKDVLGRLAACGVQMSDLALNRAAFHLFRAGHLSGAVALALSAVEAAGGRAAPGYNVWNFCVLVSAYAKLADADGIRRAAAGAAARGTAVTGERMGYQVLKQARRQLRQQCAEETRAAAAGGAHQHAEAEEALRAVEEALAQARAARQRLGAERVELQTAAMAIMRRAAADAAAAEQTAAATAGGGGVDGNESVGSSSSSSSSAEDSRLSSASSRSRASSISSLDALEEQAVAAKAHVVGTVPMEAALA